jgi:hypothetical protein
MGIQGKAPRHGSSGDAPRMYNDGKEPAYWERAFMHFCGLGHWFMVAFAVETLIARPVRALVSCERGM